MILAYTAFWVGAIADGYTTKRGLDHGAKELNPVARWAFRIFGRPVWGMVALKVAVFCLLLWLEASAGVYYTIGALQALVGASNFFGWLK